MRWFDWLRRDVSNRAWVIIVSTTILAVLVLDYFVGP